MVSSLRFRIVWMLIPLLGLLALLGGSGIVLLGRLGGSIDAILRENYASVEAMQRLQVAVTQIDFSFRLALADHEDKLPQEFVDEWRLYDKWLDVEEHNITLPHEQEMVDQLVALTDAYRRQGKTFFLKLPATGDQRRLAYHGPGGLEEQFAKIKNTSGEILDLNQQNMHDADRAARQTAHESLIGFAIGLAATAALAALLAWQTTRSLLWPLQAMTQSAVAIGAGNLDQMVPVVSRDELGQLAGAFNDMVRQLRAYRESGYARLLRAQRTSQATIDSFPDPVLVVDSEGRVEMANPAAQRTLAIPGAAEGEASPLPWDPPEALRQPLGEALRDQRPFLPEGFDRLVLLSRDGQDRSFLPRILPIQDAAHNTLGAAVLLEDVTRFRLLDQVKSDLIATVSHELKTPLTSIQLAVHLLLEEAVGPLSPKQTELLLDARDNANRLLSRVNSLLDLARLEQQHERLPLSPLAPAELLQTAADSVRPRAEDKGVKLVVDITADLPRVAADAARLGHALDNLLYNAVTYTNRGGRVSLTAKVEPQAAAAAEADGPTDGAKGHAKPRSVVIEVADTGRGIPPEYLPRVFERFFRVPGQSPEGGTGLGLAIVRQIVEAHGGHVTCDSQPGSGTVFRITLPALANEMSKV